MWATFNLLQNDNMTLTQLATEYCTSVSASPHYREDLLGCVRRFVGVQTDSLTPDWISAYTAKPTKLSSTTIHNHRRMLWTLCRYAQSRGLVNKCTQPPPRVKPSPNLPRAWTHTEMSHLLTVAAEVPGKTRTGCRRADFWAAWILFGYSTGLRFSDLHNVIRDDIRGDRIALAMRKTGRIHVCVLDQPAIEAVSKIPKVGRTVFRDHLCRKATLWGFARLVKSAGMTGSSKYLRRSSATYAELDGIGATRQLGHETGWLAAKYYVDPVILSEGRRAIPSIDRRQP